MADVKILLVEDESIEAMDIKRVLESFGYDVPYIASHGEEAVEKAIEIMPDLILMDIVLKGDTNGINAALKIKDLDIPIIYLTAHSEETMMERAKLTEPYGYIIKPYDPTELKYAIELAIYKNKMETSLRRNETLLRMMIDSAPIATLVSEGIEEEVEFINHRFTELFGYTIDDIPDVAHWWQLAYPDEEYRHEIQQLWTKRVEEAIKNKKEIEPVQANINCKDGTIRTVEVKLSSMGEKNLVFFTDLTQHKKAEEALRESEENFRAMAETANDGILIAADKEIHVYANRMAAEITGYTTEELLKTRIADLAHQDEVNKLMERYKARISGKTLPSTYETRIVRKDGNIIPIEITAAKTVWKGQQAVMVIFRDISKRRKDEKEFQIAVEKELRESEELNYLTLSNISDAIFITDDEGKFNFICPKVDVIFGYSFSEVEKMGKISKLLGGTDLLMDDLERLGEIRNIEHDITDKAGETHNLLVNVKKVSIIGGTYLYSCRDITERKKAEDALKKSRDLLEHRVEERTNELKEANRELQAISNCNQAMLRAVDEQILLEDICRIICDEAGYRLAWVGYAEHDDAKTIRPVAWAGYDSGYIAKAKLSWSEDTERGCGPAGMVIRSGELVYVQDFKTDPLMAPWRENALKRGYRSGIALPLKDKNAQTFGALLIYSAKPNAINPDEIWLMKELAGNLAFGIASLREQEALRKAEEELRLVSLYNRSLIEASLDPLVTIGKDGKIIDVNIATEKITGYSREELIGTDFCDYFTEPNKAKEGYQQVFKEGFVRDYPLEILNKDGHVTHVLYNASVYRNGSGEVGGVFAAARDITELKKAETKLKDSEARFRLLYKYSFDAILLTKPDGSILSANPAAQKMFGMKEEEIIKADRSDFVVEDKTLKHALEEREQKGKARAILTFKRKDKSTFRGEVTSNIFTDLDGNLKTSMMIRDVTEREKAEKEILQAKEEWENTFDAVPDLIAILDTNYHVVRANKAMANGLGVDPEEAVGLTCYEIVHGLNNPPSFCPHRKLLEDGEEHTAEVHEDLIGGDFIVSVSPLHDSEGKLIGSVHVARDVTERKRAEDEIKRSLKENEVLLSEIHHRVKNNMQIISSILNLQTQYVTDDETVGILQESQNRVKALATVHEKLYLSKDLTRICFPDYIHSLVGGLFYSYKFEEGQIRSIIEIEDIMLNIETTVPCGLIITELVSNSLKHAFPEGRKGEVRVSLKDYDGTFEMRVSDDGIGFPEDLDFKNTDSLGLKLVNKLVEQIDGEITLDRGHGTEFKIIFKELEYKRRI